jgi:hypothetical protein
VGDAQRAAAAQACPGGVHTFGVQWGPTIAAGGDAGGAAAAAAAPQGTRGPVPQTHWVPVQAAGQLLCGRSAGLMSAAQLRGLIAAGVDTFVCLQTAYTEYGCDDYPATLRGVSDHCSGAHDRASPNFMRLASLG